MESLSWIFFCLSPFALFCSEDGNGMILCPIFILLGFVFKWIGSKCNSTSNYVVKVEPHKFWEFHYKDRMRSTIAQSNSINENSMACEDQEARKWATTICGYHNAWVPPEDTQEQIARSNGVVTAQMLKEKRIDKDRIQIGKYFLLKELEEKYRGKIFGEKGQNKRRCYPGGKIKNDCYKLKLSNYSMISDWMVKHDYNMTVKQMWDTLTEQEKELAMKWIKEYEETMLKQINDYLEGGHDFCSVHVEY